MRFKSLYEVRKIADDGNRYNGAVWSVRGNGISRNVTIGSGMPAVFALVRALEEDKEDAEYRQQLTAKRLAGG